MTEQKHTPGPRCKDCGEQREWELSTCAECRSEDQAFAAAFDRLFARAVDLDECRVWRLHASEDAHNRLYRWLAEARGGLRRYSKKEMCKRFCCIVSDYAGRVDSAPMVWALTDVRTEAPRHGIETIAGQGVG